MKSLEPALVQYECCPYRKGTFGHRDTHSKQQVNMKTRDWDDASTSQGTPKIASVHQQLGERPGTDSPS